MRRFPIAHRPLRFNIADQTKTQIVGNAIVPKDLPGVQPPTLPGSSQQTDIYTYFTTPGETRLLTSARQWTYVRLELENAGPVVVGTKQILTPVLSGKGVLLPVNQRYTFTLAPGGRIYIAAEAINRVKVELEPFAWDEQIYQAIERARSGR
jgi:hypothetical protein